MIKKLMRSAVNSATPISCYTCRYGYMEKGRIMPLCAAGASPYQLDCIRDNFEHWEPVKEEDEEE